MYKPKIERCSFAKNQSYTYASLPHKGYAVAECRKPFLVMGFEPTIFVEKSDCSKCDHFKEKVKKSKT